MTRRMRITLRSSAFLLAVPLLAIAVATPLVRGQGSGKTDPATAAQAPRTEITIGDASASPENLTSSKEGAVYFGCTTKGTIYRALPNAPQAEPWIKAELVGSTNVLGLLADDKSNTLWVCANLPFGGGAASGQMALRAFDLKTGGDKGSYPISGGGASNDIAIAPDGTVYVSESFGGRILRLKPGAKSIEVWIADPQLRGVDGMAFLADGALYINNFFNGKLSRIAIKADGGPGAIVDIQTSLPLRRPDGMRASGPNTLLQAEGTGRLTETTINGDKGEVRVIKEGLASAAGVTQIGSLTLVLVERRKAVILPTIASK